MEIFSKSGYQNTIPRMSESMSSVQPAPPRLASGQLSVVSGQLHWLKRRFVRRPGGEQPNWRPGLRQSQQG